MNHQPCPARPALASRGLGSLHVDRATHSGALLTSRCDEPPTWRHFRSMYFDQALLMLYVRVVLFRFSEELMRLALGPRLRCPGMRSLPEFMPARTGPRRATAGIVPSARLRACHPYPTLWHFSDSAAAAQQ